MTTAPSRTRELSEQALSRLVRRFYAKARLDPVLGPVFDSAVTDWEPHLARVAAFWASAMLGVPTYQGNPMAAHRKHALTSEMFDRWLRIWAETAGEVFEEEPAEALKTRANLIADSLKLGLFFDPGKSTTSGTA